MDTVEERTGVLPDVTVIIPVYNAARELKQCLHSLHTQDYGKDRLHVLIVDDDSTDETRLVAESYGATILRNGHHNIERGKSIGLAHAQSEFVLLLDSDNWLPSPDWLRCAVSALKGNPAVVGVQAGWFHYEPRDPAANRYCSLFGIGDPVAYYLRKHDHLSHICADWTLNGTVVTRHPDYYVVHFTPTTMPTIGSQGFLTRKSLLMQTNWTPSLFHVDSNLELVAAGHNLYVILRREVAHDYVRSIAHLCSKLQRNATLFFSHQNERTHVWTIPRWTIAVSWLKMLTLIIPLSDAARGYRRLRDPAWFIHPVLCVYVPMMYMFVYLRSLRCRTKGTSRTELSTAETLSEAQQ